MQCPVCEHETGKALARCSSCETVFDRALIEELEHVNYLLSWLADHVPDPDARGLLIWDARQRREKLLRELRVEEARRARARAALPRAERLRELALLYASSLRIDEWAEDQIIGLPAAEALSTRISWEIAGLEIETDTRAAELNAPAALDLVNYALDALEDWRADIGSDRQHQRLRAQLRLERGALLAGEAAPPAAVAPAPLLTPTPDAAPEELSPAPSADLTPTPALESAATSEPDQPAPVLAALAEAKARQAEVQTRQAQRPPRRPLPRPRLPQISWATVRRKLSEAAASGALMSAFLYLNAFAIVVAAAVLVLRFPDRFPIWAQFGFILAVPTVFYLFGWIIRTRIGLIQSGSTLTNIGSLLFAVDLAAIYIFGGFADRMNAEMYWLGASVLCTLLYLVTGWRLRSEFTGYSTLVAFTSTLVALVIVLGGATAAAMTVAAATAASLPLLAPRLRRTGDSWHGLASAAERLPLLALPLYQVAVLFTVADIAWEMGATYGLAAIGYFQLVRHYATRRRAGTVLFHATVWSSVVALALLYAAPETPLHWLALAAAVVAPFYLVVDRFLDESLSAAWPARRWRLLALKAAGFGLLAVAAVAGGAYTALPTAAAPTAFWAAGAGLVLTAAVVAVCGPLYERPGFILAGGALLVLPYSAVVVRQLSDATAQWPAWLAAAWALLGLVYLLPALRARRRRALQVRYLHLLVQALNAGALFWLTVDYLRDMSAWAPGPTLAGLGGVMLVYLVVAVAQDSGRHPGLLALVAPFEVFADTVFHWLLLLLLPLLLTVTWLTIELPVPWLGAALSGLGPGYVGLGRLLSRRRSTYQLPPHAIAYALPAAGIGVALGHTGPLLAALLLGVAAYGALAAVYRRAPETAVAGLLFVWPFHLALQQTALPEHAYTLAYALLGSVGYMTLGQALAPAGFRNPWRINRAETAQPATAPQQVTLLAIGYGLAGAAAFASVAAWLGVVGGFTPWIGVAVPLTVTLLLIFSTFHFRNALFAVAAVALAAVTYGQGLVLLQVPARFVPFAWILLAGAFLLLERFLAARRAGTWQAAFRLPAAVAMLVLGIVGMALLAPDTTFAFVGERMTTYAPLLLAHTLATGLLILSARLYRSRLPLAVEPLLALVAAAVAYQAVGPTLLGNPAALVDYPLVWLGVAVLHLLAGVILDRAAVRYAHALYGGGYALALLAVVAALPTLEILVWTLGGSLLIALASIYLVHAGRHTSWADLVVRLGGKEPGLQRSLLHSAFHWYVAGIAPLWAVLLLDRLRVPIDFPWLGLALPPLVYLALDRLLLRRDADHARPYRWFGQLYTVAALMVSLPLTLRFFSGEARLPADNAAATAAMLVQSAAVLFYILAAVYYRSRVFAYAAAWLAVVPYTIGWITYGPAMPAARLAWPWMGLALLLLAIGFLLDGERLPRVSVAALRTGRYAHAPYLAGYALATFAVFWAGLELRASVVTLGIAVAVAVLSQLAVHTGRHQSFADFSATFWGEPGTMPRRVADSLFLGVAAVAFPIWLTQFLATQDLAWPWRGTALAVCAPLYVAGGLRLRHARPDYRWPLYVVGYLLTLLGPLAAVESDLHLILALTLSAGLYAASAYLFQQSAWLYLTTALLPFIALLSLRYGQRLNATWAASAFMGLGILYVAIGQLFDRRLAADARPAAARASADLEPDSALPSGRSPWFGVSPYAWPFYLPGYLLSAVALALGSGERLLAIGIYSSGAALYGVSARLFRNPFFLYPTAWLAVVPYYLLLTLTPLPAAWRGLGLLPLLVAYVLLGRFVFPRPAVEQPGWRGLLKHLAWPALPFYLLAYPGSVAMVLLSGRENLPLTLSLVAAAALYFASGALFQQQVWLLPGLLAGHLAVLFGLRLVPSDAPAYRVSVPFMAVTWVVALVGLYFQRRFPAEPGLHPRLAALLPDRWIAAIDDRSALALLLSGSWARSFFLFAAADIVLWQAVASGGAVAGGGAATGVLVAAGFALLLALLTSLWWDGALAYGAIGLATLAAGHALQWGGWSFFAIVAGLGGAGLLYFGLAWGVERARPWAPFLETWQRPLGIAGPLLSLLAVLGTLPAVVDERLATAAALGFAGLVFLGVAYRRENYPLGYGAIALLELAWALLIFDRAIGQPQWYALPAGLYFLLLGYLERRRDHHTYANYLEGLGAAVLLLTTFIQSLDGDAGRGYFLLLMVESLIIVAWGALRRVRVPFVAGIVAFTANVVGQLVIVSLADDILRWIILFVAGIVATALVVFLQWEWQQNFGHVKEWRRTLEEWL